MTNWKHFFRIETGDFAFIAVSVVALGITLTSNTRFAASLPGLLLVFFLVLVTTVIGMRGSELAERHNTLAARFLYYFIQSVLVVVLIFLSDGATTIMVLPLAGQAVPLFRTWRNIILVGFYLAALTAGSLALLTAKAIVVTQVTLSISSGIVFVIVITRVAYQAEINKHEVERLAHELGQAYGRLREYAMQAEDLATTKERNRVAREIHDGLGHYFTVINIQLEAARVLLPTDQPRAAEAIGKAQSLTKEGLAEVRQSVAALRLSPLESKPLAEAIGQLVNESQAAGILTEMLIKGEPRPLAQPIELTLYRVAQEGLTNVRKHSLATQVNLILDYEQSARVQLIVQDNGKGASDTTSGFGLLGIRERVQLLNGTLEQKTAPGAGFQLVVEIPVQLQ